MEAPAPPDVADGVAELLSRFDISTPGFEEEVAPQLPPAPTPADEPPADDETKYERALQHKELGNALFKDGKHAAALRTYLTGMEQLRFFGYADPSHMDFDLQARPVCVASYSNAALMALKLQSHELAESLCNRALQFAPAGSDLQKVLLRKAQSVLDRPQHADPTLAVQLLLQADKEASTPGGGAAARADAKGECDGLLRRGLAALLGTSAARTVDPYAEQREQMEGLDGGGDAGSEGARPKVDAAAARAVFATAEARAKEAGLRAELAHAVFGKAAGAAALEDWRGAADGFEAYFAIAAMEQSRSRPGAEFREPLLGAAYGRLHAGIALYNLREHAASSMQLSLYLKAVASFQETKVCYTDEWGNELYPDLEKELQRQRQWAVSGRVEFIARRNLAHLKHLAAAAPSAATAGAGAEGEGVRAEQARLLHEALTQLDACEGLAWEAAQREELAALREKTKGALARLEAASSEPAGGDVQGGPSIVELEVSD